MLHVILKVTSCICLVIHSVLHVLFVCHCGNDNSQSHPWRIWLKFSWSTAFESAMECTYFTHFLLMGMGLKASNVGSPTYAVALSPFYSTSICTWAHHAYQRQWLCGRVPDLQSGGCGFESQPGLLRTKIYLAFHPSGVSKWVPAAVAGKAKL